MTYSVLMVCPKQACLDSVEDVTNGQRREDAMDEDATS